MMKLSYNEVTKQIILGLTELSFSVDKIEYPQVIPVVIDMVNTCSSLMEVDEYLLDADCTTEDRELLIAGLYPFYLYSMDLFDCIDTLPQEVQDVLEKYSEMEQSYETCALLVRDLEAVGYTCDYYLDAEPFNLKKVC